MTAEEQFLEAARKGDIPQLESMLEADAGLLNARNELGQSAVLLAKYHRKPDVVQFLLGRHPDLTLHEACATGAEETVRGIVHEKGSRGIDQHSLDGFTPLALACFFGHAGIASYLVDQGANVNLAATNAMKVAPIHAAVSAKQFAIVKMLTDNGADVDQKQQQGWTPLHSAAQNGDEDTVKLLLEKGADRKARSDSGQCALDIAYTGGHARIVELLDEDESAARASD